VLFRTDSSTRLHGDASTGFTSSPESFVSAQDEVSANTKDNKINAINKGLLEKSFENQIIEDGGDKLHPRGKLTAD
jgi:hypothetical protein